MLPRKWSMRTLAGFLALLLLAGAATVIMDPAFHFHAPLPGLSYNYMAERYQNDGIIRFYDYDAMITGTSMTENFKATSFDRLFGTHSIKVPLSGGSFYEFGRQFRRAYTTGNNIRYILLSLDEHSLDMNKDGVWNAFIPDYMYDRNLLNDVSYIFNKDVLFQYALEALPLPLTAIPPPASTIMPAGQTPTSTARIPSCPGIPVIRSPGRTTALTDGTRTVCRIV